MSRLIEQIERVLNEGDKRYYEKHGIGKAKYTVSFHDGKKTHKDGSDFYDMKIFKNKKDLANFITDLGKKGYRKRKVGEN